MATKPTKQQVAQAKARAGGNNPVKVTNAGLKKLGSAAVIAASFTPAGRVARGVATVAKAAKAEGVMAKAGWNKAAKESYRASVKRGTYATPKSGVKVKPAAKQVGNPLNQTKAWESVLSSASRGGVGKTMAKAKDVRKSRSSVNKAQPDARIPARTPAPDGRGPFTYNTVKINSANPTRPRPAKKSAAQLRPKKK